MTRALIIGGGIAGPVTAMALAKIGVASTIYEAQRAEGLAQGVYLTVATNGLDALSALGLHEAVAAAGFATTRMRISSWNGKHLGDVDSDLRLADGTATTTVSRAALYQLLAEEATRRGVRFEHGKRLVGAEEGPDGIVARFADGAEADGDLLVGADGIGSATRRLVEPDAPKPEYTGLVGMGGVTRGVPLPPKPDMYQFVFGKRAFFGYIARGSGEIWWFANVPLRPEPSRAELAALTPAEWRQRLIALFAGDVMPAAQILEAADDSCFDARPMHTLAPASRWHRGRIVLVGDAAHATSPSSGQGASLAIEDGVELARCLRDRPTPDDAFATYQALREARVMRILREAQRTNRDKAAGPVGRMIRDLLMPYFMRRFATPESIAWVHGHHIDFERPVARGPAPVLARLDAGG